MNKIFIIVAIVILIMAQSGCKHNEPGLVSETLPINEFILGKWKVTRIKSDIYDTYREEYFVYFRSTNKLMFCHRTPLDTFCDKYTYSRLKDNIFLVESKRALGRKWKISRKGVNLEICTLLEKSDCLDYYRDNSGFNILLELFGFYW